MYQYIRHDFADRAAKTLADAVDEFGAYAYNDKGPREIMDLDLLGSELTHMTDEEVIEELVTLLRRNDLRVQTFDLVAELLSYVDNRPTVLDNEELAEVY